MVRQKGRLTPALPECLLHINTRLVHLSGMIVSPWKSLSPVADRATPGLFPHLPNDPHRDPSRPDRLGSVPARLVTHTRV